MTLFGSRTYASIAAAALLLFLFLFSACSDSTTKPSVTPTGEVRLHFVHVVNGDTLELNRMEFQIASGDTFEVVNLQYYLSNIGLTGPDGTYVPDNVHYIDAGSESTHEFLLTGIPERHYHSLVFTFGLDASKNHTDALPNTGDNRAMEWPQTWGGGYHYMKLEGKYLDQGRQRAFATHAGRYQDQDRPAEHHFFQVGIIVHQNVVEGAPVDIDVVMDIAEWYKTPNTISLAEHDAIMADFDQQVALQANGELGDLFLAFPEGGHDD